MKILKLASIYLLFNENLGFPGDTVDKKLPANAGDTGLIPDPEKPHMSRATKPVCHNYWAQTVEPMSPQLLKLVCLEPVLGNMRNHCSEKHLLVAARESLSSNEPKIFKYF